MSQTISAPLPIKTMCQLSGASEATVREAVQLGLVRPIWVRLQHARQLLIDPETGAKWAESYAAALATRRPPPPTPPPPENQGISTSPRSGGWTKALMSPPPRVADDPYPASDDDDDADDAAPQKKSKPRPPRKPQVKVAPTLETLADGETAFSIAELCVLSGVSRQTIMAAIFYRTDDPLPIVSAEPLLISATSAEGFIAAREARLAQIRSNKMRKKQ